MLNRAWAIRADARLTRLEKIAEGEKPDGPPPIDVAALLARIEALEAMAHKHAPGKPPKVVE